MTNYSQRGKSGGFNNRRPAGRDFGGKSEMHQAICADCKKSCEVPFRPNGKKPVYCKDCFAKNGGQVTGPGAFSPRPPRPSYSQTPSYTPAPKPQADTKQFDELKRQLEVMNLKF